MAYTYLGRNRLFLTAFTVLITLAAVSAHRRLMITPKTVQVKALNSKMIFTCAINNENELEEEINDIVWIGPDKQIISALRGRVFVDRIDARRHRLYITEVKQTDSGQYTCRAHLNETVTTAHSNLYLYDDIKFTRVDSNVTHKAGTDLLIHCVASGKPEPEISWRYKGKRLVTDSIKFTQEKQGLRIRHLRPDDSGIYECRAEVGSQGNLKVHSINVDVQYPPVMTVPLKFPPTVVRGTDATFQCQGHGNPDVTYRWFKEVKTIDGIVERYAMASDDEAPTGESELAPAGGSLVMRAVDVTDDGKYVCTVSNLLGSIEASLDFQVLVPPEVDRITWNGQEGNVTLMEGQSLELPCRASGQPLPEVYWSYMEEGSQKNAMTSLNGSTDVLTIENVTRSDSRVYTCNAVNSVGVASLEVALLVNYAPLIIIAEKDRQSVWSDKDGGWSLYAWTNQKRVFRCRVTGRPLPDVVWLRGDDEYVTSDETYSISEMKEDDTTIMSELQVHVTTKSDLSIYNRYSCVAKNSLGFENFTGHLAEALVPEMPRNLTIVHITTRSIRLTATRSRDALERDDIVTSHTALGGLDVTSWVVTYQPVTGRPVQSVTSLSLDTADDILLTSLRPNTTYVITVAAVNLVGVGSAAKIRVSTTLPNKDDKDFSSDDLQSDDGRYSIQFDAVNSGPGHRMKSRTRSSLDDEELFGVVDWGNTSAVLVVVGAVLLTTVVAAVLALVLHTRRRTVNHVQSSSRRSGGGSTVLNNRRERMNTKTGGGLNNEVTTVKVSEGRDVDDLTLQIRGRRPVSPGASIPDELYRSLGRSAKKAMSGTPEYGSAMASPRLGPRTVFGPSSSMTSSSGCVTSPLPSRAAASVNHVQPAPLAASLDVSRVQKDAWDQMLRHAEDQLAEAVVSSDDVAVEVSATVTLPNNTEDTKSVEEEDDDDDDFDSDELDSDLDQDARPEPVFEGKSFLSYSP